jgi:hypothetical protein
MVRSSPTTSSPMTSSPTTSSSTTRSLTRSPTMRRDPISLSGKYKDIIDNQELFLCYLAFRATSSKQPLKRGYFKIIYDQTRTPQGKQKLMRSVVYPVIYCERHCCLDGQCIHSAPTPALSTPCCYSLHTCPDMGTLQIKDHLMTSAERLSNFCVPT